MPETRNDPSFRGYRPHKNGLAGKLLAGITAGAEKTVDEWAEELHTTPRRIRSVLTGLRKKNHLLYPIGSIAGFKPQQGLVVDILQKKADILETMERHDLVYLAPQVESIIRILEQAVTRYPALRPMAVQLLNKSIGKLQLHGTPQHSSRENQTRPEPATANHRP